MYTIGIIEQDKALGDAMEQVLDEKGYFTVRADSLRGVISAGYCGYGGIRP